MIETPPNKPKRRAGRPTKLEQAAELAKTKTPGNRKLRSESRIEAIERGEIPPPPNDVTPTPFKISELQRTLWGQAEETIRRMWGGKWELWDKQRSIFKSVRLNHLTTVRSGNGVGKTRCVAALGILFYLTQVQGKDKGCTVFTTSAGWRELEKVLWPEIRHLIGTSVLPLGLEPLKLEWQAVKGHDRWQMVAIASKDKNNFAGFHNHRVLGIGDEADGISDEVLQAMHGNTVGEHDRLILTGNPHTPNQMFHKTFQSDQWKKIHVSCFDHPNVKEDKDLYPGMVTRRWINLMREELGEGTPAWNSRVLGDFPPEDSESVVPYGWIVAATKRDEPKDMHRETLSLSCDVARSETGDETVLMLRDSSACWKVWHNRGDNTMVTVGKIIDICKEFEPRFIAVDDVGVGGGVIDRLKEQETELYQKYHTDKIIPVNFGEAAYDNKLFLNRRAEDYWGARKLLDPSTSGFFIHPDDLIYWSQLSTVRIMPHSSGKIAIEPKDKTKARIKRSPDYADTAAISCDVRINPGNIGLPRVTDLSELGVML